MAMTEKKRVASLSRGFGISVIDTGDSNKDRQDQDQNQNNQTQQQPASSATGARPLPRVHTVVPGVASMDEVDADMSIVSESTLSEVVVDGQSNADTNPQSATTSTSDLRIDVSLSSSTLRRSSFNRHKQQQQQKPANGPDSNQQIVRASAMSQRFRSTPSFHSPPMPSSNVTSPTLLQSRSNTSSPYIAQSRRSVHNLNSYTTTRLSNRRSCQQLTKKQKDKLYDDDKDTFDETDNDILMYNVPIASSASLRLFQNGNALESSEALRKAWNESESNLIIQPSPLPGKLSDSTATFTSPSEPIPPPTSSSTASISGPNSDSMTIPASASASASASATAPTTLSSIKAATISELPRTPTTASGTTFESPSLMKNPSFSVLSPTAQQISTFYEFSSHTQAEEELRKRKQQSTPTTADRQLVSALDDLSMASAEKLSKLSVTRPSWIPPKDQTELHRHEREFKRMIERTSKEALKRSKQQIKLQHEKTIGDARLKYLSDKSSLTSANCAEVRKYILITDLDSSTKFKLFRRMVSHKLGENVLLSPPVQKQASSDDSFDENLEKLDINSLFESVPSVKPTDDEMSSLQTILQPFTRPTPLKDVDVSKLPKFPALPIETLLPRLARIALTLLRSDYSTPQVRDIIYWLHAAIFTVKFKEGFTKLLAKHSVSKLFKEFKDDYSILTVPTGLDLLLDLDDLLVLKCIEMLIVFWTLGGGRGVRVFVAIVICVIREYHFGWNNLQVIFHSKAHVYIGDDEESQKKFFGRVLGYYRLIK